MLDGEQKKKPPVMIEANAISAESVQHMWFTLKIILNRNGANYLFHFFFSNIR